MQKKKRKRKGNLRELKEHRSFLGFVNVKTKYKNVHILLIYSDIFFQHVLAWSLVQSTHQYPPPFCQICFGKEDECVSTTIPAGLKAIHTGNTPL